MYFPMWLETILIASQYFGRDKSYLINLSLDIYLVSPSWFSKQPYDERIAIDKMVSIFGLS